MIVTDSTAYFPPTLAAELGVRIVPLHVQLGDWEFAEPDVAPREFYRRLREGAATGVSPTTSQPAPGEFLQAYTEAAQAGAQRVLCVTSAAWLSGTFSSATVAAGLAPIPVDVVDSGTTSGGLLLTVCAVARAIQAGASYDEALAVVRALSGRIWSTWSSDTTALLAAGGRLTDPVPEGVAVLGLEGELRVLGSAGSLEESIQLQADRILAAAAAAPTRVTVGHGDVPALADALAAALVGRPGILAIDRYVVGPVIGAHAGPGNVGASYVVAR